MGKREIIMPIYEYKCKSVFKIPSVPAWRPDYIVREAGND